MLTLSSFIPLIPNKIRSPQLKYLKILQKCSVCSPIPSTKSNRNLIQLRWRNLEYNTACVLRETEALQFLRLVILNLSVGVNTQNTWSSVNKQGGKGAKKQAYLKKILNFIMFLGCAMKNAVTKKEISPSLFCVFYQTILANEPKGISGRYVLPYSYMTG